MIIINLFSDMIEVVDSESSKVLKTYTECGRALKTYKKSIYKNIEIITKDDFHKIGYCKIKGEDLKLLCKLPTQNTIIFNCENEINI